MTIALGMLAKDGLVIAADSQITSGDWKTSHGKVCCLVVDPDSGKRTSIVLTGAGTASYLTAAWEAISPCLASGISLSDLKGAIQRVIHEFYADHIVPFAQYPLVERPMLQLLIGAGNKNKTELWSSEFSPVIDASPYRAVGLGQNHAMAVLERLYRLPLMDCADTAVLAGHVVKLVKDADISCGKTTEIVAIRNGSWRQASFATVQAIDAASEHYCHHLEADVFRRALGFGGIPVTDFLDKSPFRGVVRELRKEWGLSRSAQ